LYTVLTSIYSYTHSYIDIIFKIVLAIILGGLIGLERESINRPAGFRTHILVCVGSALVMMISEYMFEIYHGIVNLDPARLGAQVISGIGFLGAGTIIRDGANVKGLTTAASLWVVACIGLAIGTGFYSAAIISSVMVYIVLITLKNLFVGKIEVPIIKRGKRHVAVKLELSKNEGILSNIETMLENEKVTIKAIKYLRDNEKVTVVKIYLLFENSDQYDNVINMLHDISGVNKIIEY
jgi:putative Mg2+ transporter-C (MgtC) family protein